MKNIYLIALVIISALSFGQKKDKFALINATAHLGNGTVIEKAILIINKDKIEMCMSVVGYKPDYKSFDTVIDLEGKHIYPALINANNVLGLHDAFNVRAT